MKKKRILILSNNSGGLYSFRKELLEELIIKEYEVIVSAPKGKAKNHIESLGCTFIDTSMNRRGLSIFEEIKLFKKYISIINSIKPNIILSYTIKPNIYGGIVARKYNIPFVANITGLGSAMLSKGILQKTLIVLYRKSLSRAKKVFLQNESNRKFLLENRILKDNDEIIPGSGVNLDHYHLLSYPKNTSVEFVFISRIMDEKGIREYLEAAEYIKKLYPDSKFHLCGSYEENYKDIIENLQTKGIIIYHGSVSDVREVLSKVHCIIHPSYHEGMSNVLLEAASSGRPIIASDIPGCRETFDEGISGFSFPKKDTEGLIQAIEKFIQLNHDTRERMGLAGRRKMEREFDRQIVVDKYLKEIESI